MSKPPTDAEWKAALDALAALDRGGLDNHPSAPQSRTIARALRAAIAAKDAEIAGLSKDLGRAATAANEWEVERDALKAALAAERSLLDEALRLLERQSAPCPLCGGWDGDHGTGCACVKLRQRVEALRAQADRRAGKLPPMRDRRRVVDCPACGWEVTEGDPEGCPGCGSWAR